MKTKIDTKLVKHIAKLANIPITKKEEAQLAQDFSETIEVIEELQELDVSQTPETHQVTGLINITREDTINREQMFTQQEALANASRTHNGFFVVERVIDEE